MSVSEVSAAVEPSHAEAAHRLTLLYEVAEQVNSTLELAECLDRIIDGAYRIFAAEKVSLMLLDESSNELRICAARNVPEQVMAETRVALGEGLAGKVAQSGEPLMVSDLEDDPRFRRKSKQQYRTGSFAIMPLVHRDRVLGVINLTNRADGTSFTEEDQALLRALTNQAAIAIANARLVAQINREKEQLRRRAFEANILCQVSSSIRYGLGYQHLIEVLSSSLNRLIDYDVLCSLLILSGDEDFEVQVLQGVPDGFVAGIQRRILDDLGARPHAPVVSERIEALRGELLAPETDAPAASVIAVPLGVNGLAIGMIYVASTTPDAFSKEDIDLLNSIVDKMSETVQRLQDTIRGEQDKMQSMVASMAEGAVMFDANDELVVLNPTARSMLGLPSEQELNTQGFFKSILWDEIGEFLRQPVEEDAALREFTVDSHPEPQSLAVAVTPVRDSAGDCLGRLAVIRDVTRERELDRMKSDFIAVVSHELRTPLTSIKMFTSNLLDEVEGEISDGQRECLTRMAKNLDRLARLINDLLDLSKLEAGKMKMQVGPLVAAPMLQAIAEVFEPGAATKGVRIDVQAPPDLPVLWADADRIDQVLTNLLGNALKFTPEDGAIRLQAAHRPPEPAQQIASPDQHSPISGEGYIVVSVADTGPGIPPDDLARVFDKFYQTDHSMTRKTGGTGLGLPICKEIITKHGGSIWAESTLGEGTTFLFELPVDCRKHDRAQLHASLEREIRRSKRYGVPFSVLMLDIDDFTKLNNEYGYPEGDAALLEFRDMVKAEVQKFLSARIRETDMVGRFGGDEFLVIAPETDEDGARAFGDRLRALIQKHEFTVDEQPIKTTVSIGVTGFRDQDIAPVNLVRRAAAALSKAKGAGKNTVC